MAKKNVSFKLDTKGIALFDPRKATKRTQKLVQASLGQMLGTASFNIKKEAPVGATGQLRNDITIDMKKFSGRVYAGSPHSIIIEKGRRAAPVSSEADVSLIRWLKATRKGRRMLIWTKANMMQHRKSAPSTTQVMRSALFILKRSLKNKKREPNKFFQRGVTKTRPLIRKESKKFIKELAVGLSRP